MDCMVEAHVETQHVFFLLSTRDDGPVLAGPYRFWATSVFPLLVQLLIYEASRKCLFLS
jgi:hypothetical protein